MVIKVTDLNNNSGDLSKVEPIAALEEDEFFDALEEQEPVPNAGKGGGNNGLDKVRPIATSEKQKSISSVEGKEKHFDIPLSIFRYKGYDSDFFTSWYNVSSEIFKEINRMCPEKRVLNLALSVLMLPYIASIALGLVIYNRLKTNSKTQTCSEENKTKKVSESTAKRLAYGILAAVAILVNVVVLVKLIIPATLALATFYLFNRKLYHSFVDAVKISSGLYQNENQNIEVSFHEIDADDSDIGLDMEIKFPPQFEQLLRDLYEDKDGKWFDVTRDLERNTVLKLSANIHLKNGLKPLRNEIRGMLATSIQGFTEAMGELLKLDEKDITYDKLKELLNEFRLKVVGSADSKLTNHLIQDAYRVAFIQAIKIAQEKRKGDFPLEERLKEVLVKQELESQGKKLPSEKEMIIKDLKTLGIKVPNDLSDDTFSVFKAKWKQLKEEGKIAGKIVDIYKDVCPEETAEVSRNAEMMIKELKKMGEDRYGKMHQKLKEVYENGKNGGLKDDVLRREVEDLFKFEYDDRKVEQKLIKSRMKKAKIILSQSSILDKKKQSLKKRFEDLEKEVKVLSNEGTLKEASDKVNGFIKKMYLEITKCRMQNLFEGQAKSMKGLCDLLKEDAPSLIERINSHRMRIEKYLKEPEEPILLRKIIEGNKDLNKYLEDERNSKGKEHPNTKLIEQHLENNQEILKALEDLESEKEGLLINEKTEYDYKEELISREKIKFAIIEDDLLKAFKQETFNEAEIKELLEKAELEYCLAEKCIKYPVIKTKNNIKHFCQVLLSPLIGNLVEKIINHIPKDNKSSAWNLTNLYKRACIAVNYNTLGLSAIGGENSTEGKALKVAHDTFKEVETFLQYFESSYKEVGGLIGDVFSDDGETFKKDVWPQIKNHLLGIWDRFFKDIEFTLISKDESKNVSRKLNEVNMVQLDQGLAV